MTKHLDYIQNTINRMANNSFLIKGWTITFISLLFILAVRESNIWLLALSLLPLFCFWGLDAYYLKQEKLFRELYDLVRAGKINEPFTMNVKKYVNKKKVMNWFLILFSTTIAPIYVTIILLNILIQLLIINGVI